MTKEHIPPKSFFPDGEKNQLLTVKSCELHNNSKSIDDLYVLAQICMNASPSNRAREVFHNKIVPQLNYNNGALRKRLTHGAIRQSDGSVAYKVDVPRLDCFFTALSCGIIVKACGDTLPENYAINHVYHSLSCERNHELQQLNEYIEGFYSGEPLALMEFGTLDAKNERIYAVKIFGLTGFRSSITIAHRFFGKFKVTSMLTNLIGSPKVVRDGDGPSG